MLDTMILSQVIDIKCIKTPLVGTDKQSVIAELVDLVSDCGLISSRDGVYNAVMERENIRSTGVGKGFAIPHCKSMLVEDIILAFGRCAEPIEFDSIDNEPVKLIALLISPTSKTGEHIQALAGISRVITTAGVRDKLWKDINPDTGREWTPEDIYNIITQ